MTASIADNLTAVRRRITAACLAGGRPADAVTLLAVSKTHPVTAIRAAHAAGQRAFGENRVQELLQKSRELVDLPDTQWHMIGSLQTNKVHDLLTVPGLVLLHSLDRTRLADELQRELTRKERTLEALLEVHATDEPTKHGCDFSDVPRLLEHVQARCPAVRVTGLMAMGPANGDPTPAFVRVAALAVDLRRRSGLALPILSLGMSGDLDAAIAAGSTLVRIGTGVFGSRG